MAEISNRSGARRAEEFLRMAVAGSGPVARAFRGESLRLRAMGLTYLSLFALVPAMVVAFTVLQAFTGMDRIWLWVHEFLLDNLAVGARTSIEPYLDRFVKNAHAASAGLVGGGLLVWSAVSLFGYVERAVNDLWAIRRRRPLRQQILTYWAGITLGPLLLALSAAIKHGSHAWLGGAGLGGLAARATALLLSCAFFALLYGLIPATKVRFLPAAIGGVMAGVAWEVARLLYTWAATRFFRLHAIYGSLAFFPIFLTWLYVSWVLLLFGARVAFVAQNARSLLQGQVTPSTQLARELVLARVLLEVSLAFDRGRAPAEPAEIAVRLGISGESVFEALAQLRQGGLLADLAGGGATPARPLQTITLADVRRIVAGSSPSAAACEGELVAGVLASAEELAAKALSEVTYAQLCARSRAGSSQAGGQQLESA